MDRTHLYTIPSGETLPDLQEEDVPEGLPFLLDGRLHLHLDGAWVEHVPVPDYSGASEGDVLKIVSGVPEWAAP